MPGIQKKATIKIELDESETKRGLGLGAYRVKSVS